MLREENAESNGFKQNGELTFKRREHNGNN
jgi:hypothetical protein